VPIDLDAHVFRAVARHALVPALWATPTLDFLLSESSAAERAPHYFVTLDHCSSIMSRPVDADPDGDDNQQEREDAEVCHPSASLPLCLLSV
jgi:hypothetical protein